MTAVETDTAPAICSLQKGSVCDADSCKRAEAEQAALHLPHLLLRTGQCLTHADSDALAPTPLYASLSFFHFTLKIH